MKTSEQYNIDKQSEILARKHFNLQLKAAKTIDGHAHSISFKQPNVAMPRRYIEIYNQLCREFLEAEREKKLLDAGFRSFNGHSSVRAH